MFGDGSAKLSVLQLPQDGSNVLPTPVENQIVYADVRVRSLSVLSLGGISPSLSHV